MGVVVNLPELPEVETVVRYLAQLKNRKITTVEVIKENLLKDGVTKEKFAQTIGGQTINRIERKGKHIFFILDSSVIISHLRMTGKYFLKESFIDSEHLAYLGAIFHFDDGSKLFFCDARNFATFHLQKIENYKSSYPYIRIGSDLINDHISGAELFERWKSKKTPIKASLLEQDVISGIGNIYASEILHLLRTHPLTITSNLSEKFFEEMLMISRKILQESIDLKGTSIVDFKNPNNESGSFQQRLRVYGKVGVKCLSCSEGSIQKIFIDGRSTFFCPACQLL